MQSTGDVTALRTVVKRMEKHLQNLPVRPQIYCPLEEEIFSQCIRKSTLKLLDRARIDLVFFALQDSGHEIDLIKKIPASPYLKRVALRFIAHQQPFAHIIEKLSEDVLANVTHLRLPDTCIPLTFFSNPYGSVKYRLCLPVVSGNGVTIMKQYGIKSIDMPNLKYLEIAAGAGMNLHEVNIQLKEYFPVVAPKLEVLEVHSYDKMDQTARDAWYFNLGGNATVNPKIEKGCQTKESQQAQNPTAASEPQQQASNLQIRPAKKPRME
ncbi:Protein of unknown function [Pyronema omphalodes CBS 100304]|uniref:Uncharacterized protein n=1 Tax=Pyronema omphalodes (strain CBS 100304) TaxID=1076935 RepID=U4L1V7_PYROM|nr:Protein of unknown function [Pyronema omphalodes CBS 100304]